MADNKVMGGLPDPSKISQFGAPAADVEEYQRSLEDSVRALEQRYAQPNWFNVAAGFFKPQLGGFAASLGSASQALGENVEKQREAQLPIAQMRAQLAASKIGMGQNKSASEAFAAWKATGKPMDEATYSQIVALAPNSSVAAAAKAAYEGEKTEKGLLNTAQQLRQEQGRQAMSIAAAKYSTGAMSKQEYNQELARIESTYGPTAPVAPNRPVTAGGTPAAAAPVADATVAAPAAAPAAPAAPAAAAPVTSVVPWTGKKLSAEDLAQFEKEAAEGKPGVAEMLASYKASTNDKGQVVITSPLGSNAQGLSPDVLNEQIKVNETDAAKRFNDLKAIAGPGGASGAGYKPINNVVESQINLLKNNRDLTKEVTALLTKGDLWSQFQAAVDEGVGFNLQGLTGQVRLPVKTFKTAGLNDTQLGFLQTLANNYAKIATYQQKMAGVNPNAASNIELNMYKALTPTTDTVGNAALKSLAHFKIDLDAMHDQYNFVNDVYHGRHPDVVLANDVPDRYASIFAHPTYDKVYDKHQERHDQLNSTYQEHLKNAQVKKPKTP
jgi:hypothetical protein